ncbi:MAG: hypothetical protein US25_C0051G0003 [Candidatus Moranbacteria bacterium GW2011_GWE1_36_7]|nr:MAG: hypothetical protein UR99_C0030G0006 [Candidatus Moranbacteria bacterium GW2011_GWD2_36_12]KKQ05807.1 MAG: hypothetical protein US16_C0030G0006 [Candidatus Moranbacteria bacterium GW2011_GWE2_36_40]KKQ12370.1 MAG: hypothetical protein US25_C0051G0003 [Candidatus Moranbacteria bacterium GW2011_GWE1_36_7]
MKILFINYWDKTGGAAIAAHRLYRGLLNRGVKVEYLVQHKITDDENVHLVSQPGYINKIVNKYSEKKINKEKSKLETMFPWSINLNQSNIIRDIKKINPDVVHFHWIGHNLVNIGSFLKINKPIVWTLHDSWAFTGGCHIPYDCRGYENECGSCPQLKSDKVKDLSSTVLEEKQKTISQVKNITIVCPSKWLTVCAKKSSVLKRNTIYNIPNGLNINVFKEYDSGNKKRFGFSKNKKIVLFGSVGSLIDENKGAALLLEAIRRLLLTRNDIELAIFGSEKRNIEVDCNTIFLGNINDEEELSSIYSCVDVFVAPSKSENLPNTVLESLASGTPVVAFNIGGIPDIITHKFNGYLAKPFDVNDLSDGIGWVLDNKKRLESNTSKSIKEKFDIENISETYIKLYNEII